MNSRSPQATRRKIVSDISELEAEVKLSDSGGLGVAFDHLVVLGSLTDRESNVLKLRLGICGNHVHTLRELGKLHNVAHQTISRIESGAFCKLKVGIRKRRIRKLKEEAKAEGVKFKFIA